MTCHAIFLMRRAKYADWPSKSLRLPVPCLRHPVSSTIPSCPYKANFIPADSAPM
ncbi:uncharacterized protein LOC119165032 isoform X2 [Rhipicephalus microplus]|uniref:uncharacterized protein LOC119165032 isoform X2 n=1 Tax=Rhipicephalus microplus TaxID=6941 RepID=UPI003F6CF997